MTTIGLFKGLHRFWIRVLRRSAQADPLTEAASREIPRKNKTPERMETHMKFHARLMRNQIPAPCAVLLFLGAMLMNTPGWAQIPGGRQDASPPSLPDAQPDAHLDTHSSGTPPADAALPDAPAPELNSGSPTSESSSLAATMDLENVGLNTATSTRVARNNPERVPLDQCPTDTSHARECRVHWGHLLATSAAFNAFQNVGTLYTGYWYRWETTHGPWFQRWFDSVSEWRWTVWNDQNPVLDDYVGHPIMGAITNYLWIQDDPRSMTVEIGNTPEYWHSRMRALVFSTAYSFQWKLGPFGEAGIGHNGDHLVPQGGHRPWTNETGWVELVTTPVGGLVWTMAEDALDKHVVRHFEEKPRGPIALLAISALTPARATANIFRFRPPWYRDGRVVKAASFWSDPPGPDDNAAEGEGALGGESANAATNASSGAGEGASASGVTPAHNGEPLPLWPRYGGVHEFGAWWGASVMTGHIWGYAKDIRYMPIDVNYSYLINPGSKWNFRYSPEITALAMLDEPRTGQKSALLQRKRTYGSGASPVGFRASFFPQSRVQPFFSTNGGFIYFVDRVLSPQGSQFMFTIDFGGGLEIFRKERQAVTIGYRYQHLSNGNISRHNPGTDTNVFYVAISRFRSKGYR